MAHTNLIGHHDGGVDVEGFDIPETSQPDLDAARDAMLDGRKDDAMAILVNVNLFGAALLYAFIDKHKHGGVSVAFTDNGTAGNKIDGTNDFDLDVPLKR